MNTRINQCCALLALFGIALIATIAQAKEGYSKSDLYKIILQEERAYEIDLPHTHIKRIIPASFIVPSIDDAESIAPDDNTYLILEYDDYHTAISTGLYGHSFEFSLNDINGDHQQDLLVKYINQRQMIIQPFYFDLTELLKHPQDFRSHLKGKVFFEDGRFYEIEYSFLPYKWEKEGYNVRTVIYSLNDEGLFIEEDRNEEFVFEANPDNKN